MTTQEKTLNSIVAWEFRKETILFMQDKKRFLNSRRSGSFCFDKVIYIYN